MPDSPLELGSALLKCSRRSELFSMYVWAIVKSTDSDGEDGAG
jgi:hypothetical protein